MASKFLLTIEKKVKLLGIAYKAICNLAPAWLSRHISPIIPYSSFATAGLNIINFSHLPHFLRSFCILPFLECFPLSCHCQANFCFPSETRGKSHLLKVPFDSHRSSLLRSRLRCSSWPVCSLCECHIGRI